MTPHQRNVVKEAEQLALSGLSILALHVPGEALPGGRTSTGKEPRERGWSKKPNGEDANKEVLGQLRRRESNLGVRLGKYSRGLADVDMDCPESIILGELWLPETTWVFGRKSAPASHRVYTWEDWNRNGEGDNREYKTRKFHDVRNAEGKKATLLEIRSTGGQTAFPGTRHHTGEMVEWEGKRGSAPGSTKGDEEGWDLDRCAEMVAAGSMLARNWPDGTYHDGTLALAGGLARAGWDIRLAKDFLLGVGSVLGMNNLQDRERVIEDTYRKLDDGENVQGWPSVAKIFGDDVVKEVRNWLRISKDLVADQGELGYDDEVPWALFPNVKSKLVDGERVVTGLKGTWRNLQVVINAYGIEVMYDVIARVYKYKSREQQLWKRTDNEFRTEIDSLAALNGLPCRNIQNQLDKVAKLNCVNPVVDWLEKLEWDGKNHVNTLCNGIEIVGGREELRWFKKLMRKWFIQACAAADGAKRTPNSEALPKYEFVLVLHGNQGALKTSWIYRLVPPHLRDYVKTSLHVNPADRDSIQKATTCWIGEIGELDATFRKADISQLKAFLSQTTDEYRVPYGVESEAHDRHTAFGASVNEFNFLQDSTGNRRFWVAMVRRMEQYGDMSQVWAQAWAEYMKGESWWLTPQEDRDLHVVQRQHMATEMDPVYEAMHDAFPDLGASVKKSEWMTIAGIAERVGLVYGLEKVDQKMARKIASFMREYSQPYRGQDIEKRPGNKLRFALPKRVKTR